MTSDHCVSLLAACLPDVDLMPFHVDRPALPQLAGNKWSQLLFHNSQQLLQQQQKQQQPGRQSQQQQHQQRHLQTDPKPSSTPSSTLSNSNSPSSSDGSSSSSRSHNVACILLSSPQFTQVEGLLQLLSNTLPCMPVLGGVTEPDAWLDTEHRFGALFLGEEVLCQGAVGCIMQGPLQVKHMLLPGCRPAVDSPVMTVTEADGNVILALDGQPVHQSVSAEWGMWCARSGLHVAESGWNHLKQTT